MPRIGVQYQDVVTVASELASEGVSVTHEHVRSRLGTGSNSTLARHLKRWRETHPLSEESVSLSATLSQHVASVWHELSTAADNRVLEITTMAQLIISTLSDENLKLRENGRRWQELHEKWSAQKSELVENLERQEASIGEHKTVYVEAQHINSLLNRSIEEKQNQIDSLENHISIMQKNLEHFREAAREQLLMEQDKQSRFLEMIESSLTANTENVIQAISEDKPILENIIDGLNQSNANKFAQENALKETNEMLYALQRAVSTIQSQFKHVLPKTKLQHKKIKNKFIL
jgi:chromosome segregation ATPase